MQYYEERFYLKFYFDTGYLMCSQMAGLGGTWINLAYSEVKIILQDSWHTSSEIRTLLIEMLRTAKKLICPNI